MLETHWAHLILPLLVVHFGVDFMLQTQKGIKERNQKKYASPYVYGHGFLHGALSWLILGFTSPVIAVIIGVSHTIIDIVKACINSKKHALTLFAADQALHLIIIAVAVCFWGDAAYVSYLPPKYWLIILGFILILNPTGLTIGMICNQWKFIEEKEQKGLKNAGKYIGMLERLLVYMLVLSGNISGVGFVVGAKSIFRFGDLNKNDERKHTEYILIGTLLSITISLLISLLVYFLLNRL